MIGAWWLAIGLAGATSLDEARTRAADGALAVLSAEASRDASQGASIAAIEAALPAVEGFAQVATGQGLTSFGFERPVATQIGIGGQLSWRLIDVATWLRASAARREVRRSEAVTAWARVDARREATARYAAALSASQAAQALASAADEASALSDAIAARVEAGLTPEVDGLRARAEAAVARAQAEEARADAAATCVTLQALIGDAVDGVCTLESVAWAQPATGEGDHPSIQAFRLAMGAATARSDAAAAALGPVLSASGTAAHYIIPASDTQGFGWNVGATLTVPLPGASSVGDQQAGRALAKAADVALEEQRRALSTQAVTAEARHRAAIAAWSARQEAADAAEAAMSRAQALYDAGALDLTDLLDARRAWSDARRLLAVAHGMVGTAVADLEAARGVW